MNIYPCGLRFIPDAVRRLQIGEVRGRLEFPVRCTVKVLPQEPEDFCMYVKDHVPNMESLPYFDFDIA
eukprot:12415269-Karenia_brevis.AAC.1